MPTIPPIGPSKRTPKRAPKNTPPVQDTPSPPTEPTPEPEPTVKPPARPRSGTLEARLGEAFASVSILPSFAGDQYSSFILASRSAKFSHDLAELAKVNSRVKRMLEGLLDGGAYGGVMFSGAAMLLPILWSYGIIPAPPFDPFSAFYPSVPPGVVPRSVRAAGSSAASGAASAPSGGDTDPVAVRVPPGGGAPGPAAVGLGANGSPVGVVTVRPGAHPPVSPAAAQ